MRNKFTAYIGLLTITTLLAGCGMKNLNANNADDATPEVMGTQRSTDNISTDEFYENVYKIDMNAHILDITIEKSDSDKVEAVYNGIDALTPQFEYNKKTKVLNIKQNEPDIDTGDEVKCDLLLKLPAKSTVKFINIFSHIGSINVGNIATESIMAQTRTADVNIDGMKAQKISVTSSLGSVKISRTDFDDIEINSKNGDIDLTTVSDTKEYDIKLETVLGNNFVDNKFVNATYTRDAEESRRGEIIIISDLGDISVYQEK